MSNPVHVTQVDTQSLNPYIDPARTGATELVRVYVTGTEGEHAAAFVSLVHKRGRWYVRLEHDATDYGSARTDYRQKEIELRFHA